MDVREAVKDKANYAGIVRYFENTQASDPDQMLLMVQVLEAMSEEIFEHYRALQLLLRRSVGELIDRRRRKGNFSFLSVADRQTFAEVLVRGSRTGALNPEHFEDFLPELQQKVITNEEADV